MSGRVYRFGEFEFHFNRRELTASGKSVRLGGRAFELLGILLMRAGKVVSKDMLYSGVWPGVYVEESNLRVHIAAIRRALGEQSRGSVYIKTVSGRGYVFVADVAISDDDSPAIGVAIEGWAPDDAVVATSARPRKVTAGRSAKCFANGRTTTADACGSSRSG